MYISIREQQWVGEEAGTDGERGRHRARLHRVFLHGDRELRPGDGPTQLGWKGKAVFLYCCRIAQAAQPVLFKWARLCVYIATKLPKLLSQSYSNGLGNFGRLSSGKEIQWLYLKHGLCACDHIVRIVFVYVCSMRCLWGWISNYVNPCIPCANPRGKLK